MFFIFSCISGIALVVSGGVVHDASGVSDSGGVFFIVRDYN